MKLRPITSSEWLSLRPGETVYFLNESHLRVVVEPPKSFSPGHGKFTSKNYASSVFGFWDDYKVPEDFRMKEKTSTYIIWNKGSNLPPKVTFTNRQEAIKAAYSMASKFPGERFNVCKLVGHAEVTAVKYEDYEA